MGFEWEQHLVRLERGARLDGLGRGGGGSLIELHAALLVALVGVRDRVRVRR